LSMGKVFDDDEAESRVNSVDHFKDGEWMISSADDGTVVLYSVQAADVFSKFSCKKYGANKVIFTHHSLGLLVPSNPTINKFDTSIRYLSLHNGSYYKIFSGHTDVINAISLSPIGDTFLSCALDSSIRIWDMRTQATEAMLKRFDGHHVAAFERSGNFFSSISTGNVFKRFDMRELGKGPLLSIELGKDPYTWESIQIAPDDSLALLTSHQGASVVVEIQTGTLKRLLKVKNDNKCRLGACFSPDGNFVFLGTEDGNIDVYRSKPATEQDDALVVTLRGHTGPVGALQFNPQFDVLSSGCSLVALWQPRSDGVHEQQTAS